MLDKPYYTIGEVSELCDVPAKTLRYYDTIGLMNPEHRDRENNYRHYTKEQFTTILTIKNLRRFGFCLKEINQIITLTNPQLIEAFVQKKLAEKRQAIEEMTIQYTEAQYFLARLQKGFSIFKQQEDIFIYQETGISLESIGGINLFFNRKKMKNYKNAEMSLDRWRDIIAQSDDKRLKICGPIYVTFLNDNPLDKFLLQDNIVEFAVQVEKNGSETEFRELTIPKAITAIHIGSYSTILNVYIKMINWIKANNYEISGYCTEEFIISPLDIVDDSHHITRVIIPVEKIKSAAHSTKKKSTKNEL